MSLPVSKVQVDNRQKNPSPSAWIAMLENQGLEAEKAFIEPGDFQWYVTLPEGGVHLVAVEHKTIKDFLDSVGDGRVANFVRAETVLPMTKILMVIWNGGDVNKHGRHYSAKEIWHLLLEVQSLEIGVVLCKNTAGGAATLAGLYRFLAKEEHLAIGGPKLPVNVDMYNDPNERARVRTLMTVPGLGEKRARMLLSYYDGNLWWALEACREGIIDVVDGIGKRIAATAKEYLQ